MDQIEFNKYIPLDKSWIIRMGILDIINGKDDILKFLNKQEILGDDLLALKRVASEWNSEKSLNVGESGTLYRFVRFILWKQGKIKEIIKEGTLKERVLCENSDIINWPIVKLLSLDNGTSQWASAAILMGNNDKIQNPPFKIQTTYDAVRHWNEQRGRNQVWIPIFDSTIKKQAKAFDMFLKTGFLDFKPEQPEDYCFARAFGLMNKEEGQSKWPHMISHETNRFEEMEKALEQANNNEIITSKDHRVVQAVIMAQIVKNKDFEVENKEVVNKTWPKFWEFIRVSQSKLL